MLGIIGKKIGMTRVQINRQLIPCTVIQSEGCVITQIKESSQDGYNAVQLAYDEKKVKNTTQPLLKHFKKAGTTPKKRMVEFTNFSVAYPNKDTNLKLGSVIRLEDIFEEGEFIDAQARSKGKGFQGVVKRYGFKGVGDKSHGQHNRERAPGSIGGASYPSRVFPGMRMAGQMGNKRITVKNLEVLKIIPEENLLILRGAVPGPKNSYITLRK